MRQDAPVAVLALRVVGVVPEQEHGTGGSAKADTAAQSVERTRLAVLVQVQDQQSRQVALVADMGKRGQRGANVLVLVAIEPRRDERDERVKHEQPRPGIRDPRIKLRHAVGHVQARVGVIAMPYGLEEVDARGVAAGGDEPRHERVLQAVLGAHVGDMDRLAFQRACELAGGRAGSESDA